MVLNGAGARDTGAWVMAEGVGTERGRTAPEGDGTLSAVRMHGVANSTLEGLPDVRAVVGTAVVVTDGAVAVTVDTGDTSMPTTRGLRG